jgi:hypothetical protein
MHRAAAATPAAGTCGGKDDCRGTFLFNPTRRTPNAHGIGHLDVLRQRPPEAERSHGREEA